MRRSPSILLGGLLAAATACVGDDPVSSSGGLPDAGTTTPNDAGADSPTVTDSGGNGDASIPTSTFCADRIAAIGSALLFCADFDDPTSALGGYPGGSFSSTAFTKDQLLGGVASPQTGSLGAIAGGRKLVIDKPANASAVETGARYATTISVGDPKKGVRIVFDSIVTRPAAVNPLLILALHRGDGTRFAYFEDNNGSPALVGSDGGSQALFAKGAMLGAAWHVELSLDPNPDNTAYTLTGSMNGVPMEESGGTATSKLVATALPSTCELKLGLTSDTVNDGAATGHYDNLIVQHLH